MRTETGEMKAKRFLDAIVTGVIEVERRPNHGKDFSGAYENLHRENFKNYLGSCTRYLSNQRMREQKYYG